MRNSSDHVSTTPTVKARYVAPEIVAYGDADEITETLTSGPNSDGGSVSPNTYAS